MIETGVTVGVYVAEALFPFTSSRTTVTAGAVPTKFGSGTNVTVPSAATVNLPTPSTVLVVEPSSNVAGTSSLIGTVFSTPLTSTVPPLNSGLPVCVAPWMSVVSAGVAVGVTPTTVGVYDAEAFIPFLSSRTTVTAGAVPTKFDSGTNVTVPSAATVNVPTPLTVLVVEPSSNVAGTSSLISTVFSTPLTSTVPPLNSGLPVCVAPWMSFVSAGVAVGVTPTTVGVYLAVAVLTYSS